MEITIGVGFKNHPGFALHGSLQKWFAPGRNQNGRFDLILAKQVD